MFVRSKAHRCLAIVGSLALVALLGSMGTAVATDAHIGDGGHLSSVTVETANGTVIQSGDGSPVITHANDRDGQIKDAIEDRRDEISQNRDDRRADRQDDSEDQRDDRQDARSDERDDRQDERDDNRDQRDDRRDDRQDRRDDRHNDKP